MTRPTSIEHGRTIIVQPGDHFDLVLPDGNVLNVEQTADDFTIVRSNGFIAYTAPTSESAKANETDGKQTTGRN
jgi:hypothetical protein